MSLLGFMAAGGATAYADVRNREVQEERALRASIFKAEMEDMFQQRVEARRAAREDVVDARNRERHLEDIGSEREFKRGMAEDDRSFRREDRTSQQKHTEKMEGIRQAGSDRRAELRSRSLLRSIDGDEPSGVDTSQLNERYEKLAKQRRELQKELHSLGMPGKRGGDSEYARVLQQDLADIDRAMSSVNSQLKAAIGTRRAQSIPPRGDRGAVDKGPLKPSSERPSWGR